MIKLFLVALKAFFLPIDVSKVAVLEVVYSFNQYLYLSLKIILILI